MRRELLHYQIPRTAIEAMNCTDAVHRFDPTQVERDELRALCNRVTFVLAGYDCRSEEPFLIPEIRRFVRQWHALRPNWLYFTTLENDNLSTLYLSLLDSIESVQSGSAGLCITRFNTGELMDVLVGDLMQADALASKLGFSEAQRAEQTRAVLRYFRLPGGDV